MESMSEIRQYFSEAGTENLPELIERYRDDERASVGKLVQSAEKKLAAYRKELERMREMYHYENLYPEIPYIGGIDEVGRGPLAGPVVACCVILPQDCDILYLNDSKQVPEKKREELYEEITKKAVSIGIGVVSHEVIDEINILQATFEAMRQAIASMSVQPQHLLVDAVKIPDITIPQRGIIKGDAKSASIAAASIVAKVTRDRMMCELDKEYTGYGFAKNKGYGSAEHIKALQTIGPCEIHRRSFIGNFIGGEQEGL